MASIYESFSIQNVSTKGPLTLTDLLHCMAAFSNSYPNACVPSRAAVCTIIMMVFGMTRPGYKPMTYRMRGGRTILVTSLKMLQSDWLLKCKDIVIMTLGGAKTIFLDI